MSAVVSFSSSTVSAATSGNAATSANAATRGNIKAFAGEFRRGGFGQQTVENATLRQLMAALCCEYDNLSQTSEKTVPPQAKFNQTVLAGFNRLRIPHFVGLLESLLSFADEQFAQNLLNSIIADARNPSVGKREDYQDEASFKAALADNKPWCILAWCREKMLDDVPAVELVRAIRHLLGFMCYRVFRTRDLSETKTITIKGKETKVHVCNPDRAEFRVGNRTISSEKTRDFASFLIDAYDFILGFSAELKEFDFIKEAASTCKREREAFKAERAARQDGATVLSKNASPANQRKEKVVAKPAPKSMPVQYYRGPVGMPPAVNPWSQRKEANDAQLAAAEAKAHAERAQKEAQEALERAQKAQEEVERREREMREAQEAQERALKAADDAATLATNPFNALATEDSQDPQVEESQVEESTPEVQPLNQKGQRFTQSDKRGSKKGSKKGSKRS